MKYYARITLDFQTVRNKAIKKHHKYLIL